MREHLYQGKRKDNGEWVQGDLIHRQIWASSLCIIRVSDDGFDNYEEYEVDPETVSEYTGLDDKSGKRIFEGNLLKIVSWVRGAKAEGEKRQDIAEVQYNGNTGGFKLRVYHDGKYKRISKFSAGHLCAYDAEVIGNKWDNPELLER